MVKYFETRRNPVSCVANRDKENYIVNNIQSSISKFPSRIAIETNEKLLTYSKLGELIKQYSYTLNKACYGSLVGRHVLIYMDSPFEAMLTQLAILQNGAICVPLNRQTPLAYYSLEHMANIACIVVDDYELQNQMNFPIVRILESESAILLDEPECLPEALSYSEEYSYCIMTSGTTGTSKAIKLTQKAIINQIEAKINVLEMDCNSRVCLSMNQSFVASIWQVLATLFVGGTIIVLDNKTRLNPYDVFKKAENSKASILCVTPSFLRAFLLVNRGARKISIKSLSKIVLTGEILHSELVKKFYQDYDVQLINAYGQTESADDTFHYIVPKDFEFESHPIIPIGYPIPYVNYIIDEGELCISGRGVTSFRTGDLVSQRFDWSLVCHGRKDNQIKINGYRISPEAIEACCTAIDGVADALVVKVEVPAGAYLHLQYVLVEESEKVGIEEQYIAGILADSLPHYMMPSKITRVTNIMYSSNGKKVRK